ncbi:hypothetical protein SprV_0301167400 [Sparganum proliferum]
MTDTEPKTNSPGVSTLSFKLPPFTPSNPRVWFRQIEAVFSTSRITTERTRYSYMVQSLPFDVAVDVDDLLDPIPANDQCTQLKNALSRERLSLTTGKRPRQPVTATAAAGQSRPSRLFYISDKSSDLRFLVDTDAEISVIAPPRRHHLKPSQFSLQAANSTTINTCGQRPLTLDIGLRRRFHPHCAATLAPLTDLLKSKAKPIELSPATHSASEATKKALADVTLLHHLSFDPQTQMTLTTDASNSAVGAVLHQQVNNQLRPLAFISQKPQPAQTRYSTFSRKLLAIYLAIRHFRHLLEGRDLSVHTDHKPLNYALKAKPDRYSPREIRHLEYISQFTADIRYVRGSDNVVADALSRPDINTLTLDFDLAKPAYLQSGDKSIDDLRSNTTLQLRDVPLPASPDTIMCDWSTGTPRPVVPVSYRKTVFDHFHSLSHPGIRASRKLIAARFIWPRMNSDIAL